MKYFLVLVFFLFLVDCGSDKKTDVITPGTGSFGSLAFSKICSGGSFQVYKKSVVGAVGPSQINSLPVGASVSVKGVINDSPCHSGSVKFTCEGTVAIDTNRAIICNTGTVQGGVGSSLTTTTTQSSSLIPNLLQQNTECNPLTHSCGTNINPLTAHGHGYGSVNLIQGQVHTYDNGTKAYVNIEFPRPRGLSVHGNCSTGFAC